MESVALHATPTPVSSDPSDPVTVQLRDYLIDPDVGVGVWKKYSLLEQTSLKFNTPLTSSALVERLFSLAGIIDAPWRQTLGDFCFEKLVLLNANDHLFNGMLFVVKIIF